MIVKYQKQIEFVNTYNILVDLKELEQAILWYQDKPTSRLKKIYLLNGYPTITIFNKKLQIHRLLYMYWNKTKTLYGYVHHIDKNKFNASKDNLILMDKLEHQSLHNKGKTISEEHKQKIREYNFNRDYSKRKHNRNKPRDKNGKFISIHDKE